MAEIIDGTKIAADIRQEIKEKLGGTQPGLAFILIGEDPGSKVYVGMKEKACKEVGFHSRTIRFLEDVPEDDLIAKIHELNQDDKIHGILIQQPLPSHISTQKVVEATLPEKDVDGFHPINLGKAMMGDDTGHLPCTPLGVLTLLGRSGIDPGGKHVVIAGRSNIVGKPLATMLAQKKPGCNATVTLAHSRTRDLPHVCRTADILISAIGRPHYITADMVRKGAVVIDVGINRQNGKLVGDVDYDSVSEIASHITPVPGGVGPMTIAMLLYNTYQSFTRCTNGYYL
jgi:methylenetetrahydrofolate dehydrogenase (NADP+) / methenyltetrahydrofolate cyclohydrolase